ncbi:MAG: T9SS type A sorting domain-containing protein [Candidatus Kapaibacterium sp.]
MKKLFATILAALVLVCGHAHAQDTTSLQFVYGSLVRATPETIEVRVTNDDGSTGSVNVAYDQNTQFIGCVPDSVMAGVQTFAQLTDANVSPRLASLIKFEGCFPQFHIQGVIRALKTSAIDVETSVPTEFGGPGTVVSLDLVPQTALNSCAGDVLKPSDLNVGDPVIVIATGPLNDPDLYFLQAQTDCPEHLSAEARFLSYTGKSMSFVTEGTTDTLVLRLDAKYLSTGMPLDSNIGFYGCSGQFVSVNDVLPGTLMTLAYLSISGKGQYLQYGYIKENCPVYLRGKVQSVRGDTVALVDQGQTAVVVVSSSTDIKTCRGQEADINDVTSGMTVEVQALEKGATYDALSLLVLEDCPYAFVAAGVIKRAENSSVSIETINPSTGEPEDITLNLDSDTRIADCVHLPLTSDALVQGSSVVSYYRTTRGALIADLIVVTNPCNSEYIAGSIASATSTSIVVNGDDGSTKSYAVTASSALVDCRGEVLVVSNSLQGERIEGYSFDFGNGATVSKASIYVNCVRYAALSGIVENSTDSVANIRGAQGVQSVLRSANTIIVDQDYTLLEWSALTQGRSVCMWINEPDNTVMYATVDALCDSSSSDRTESTMVIGTSQSMSSNVFSVSTKMGDMTFAITPATQMMDEKRNLLSASSVAPGIPVRVMTRSFTADGKPIASSVVAVTSTTSVDERNESSDLTIAPNPASSMVSFSSSRPFEQITITNILGARVAELRDATRFDASELAPGLYFVNARRGAESVTRKLQIER